MTDLDQTFLREVLNGLACTQKTIHPKWLYDQRGSELFEDITDVPEYYPTRTEAKIFQSAFPDIKKRFPEIDAVIEYGSGASKKISPLLNSIRPQIYIPIDISEDFLKESAADIQRQHPDVQVRPIVGDFTSDIELPGDIPPPENRLGFFPGSTIGNFEPGTAVPFLSRVRKSLGDGSHFLISGDLIKDRDVLEAAYDDAGGVTAEFNMNLLDRMNRELGANFDRNSFSHQAVFNEDAGRIEMHLVSLKDQTVTINGTSVNFAEGESIHTESSHKYTVDSFEAMSRDAGWKFETFWTDDLEYFGVFLLSA